MTLTSFQEELCSTSTWDFSGPEGAIRQLHAQAIPGASNTEGLIASTAIMARNGVEGRCDPRRRPRARARRLAGHARARGGGGRLARAVRARPGRGHPRSRLADLARREVVRVHARHRAAVRLLAACSTTHGQYAYYGKVGGCLVTGNEDGIKHCAMNILYSLQHLGYMIPPQADAGWIGEAGPGPSLPRPGLGRPGQRLHQPEHDVHDVEPHASRRGC